MQSHAHDHFHTHTHTHTVHSTTCRESLVCTMHVQTLHAQSSARHSSTWGSSPTFPPPRPPILPTFDAGLPLHASIPSSITGVDHVDEHAECTAGIATNMSKMSKIIDNSRVINFMRKILASNFKEKCVIL